jgi:hypothetical protein
MLWKLDFITIWISNLITEFERKVENTTHFYESDHSSIKNDTLP